MGLRLNPHNPSLIRGAHQLADGGGELGAQRRRQQRREGVRRRGGIGAFSCNLFLHDARSPFADGRGYTVRRAWQSTPTTRDRTSMPYVPLIASLARFCSSSVAPEFSLREHFRL